MIQTEQPSGKGVQTAKKCSIRLHHIGYRDAGTGMQNVFRDNHFPLAAKTISDECKSRWQVELIFKWIKQNPKIKSFVEIGKNVVLTQVWIMNCVYLILAFIELQSKLSKSMHQILRFPQTNIFQKRHLVELLR